MHQIAQTGISDAFYGKIILIYKMVFDIPSVTLAGGWYTLHSTLLNAPRDQSTNLQMEQWNFIGKNTDIKVAIHIVLHILKPCV